MPEQQAEMWMSYESKELRGRVSWCQLLFHRATCILVIELDIDKVTQSGMGLKKKKLTEGTHSKMKWSLSIRDPCILTERILCLMTSRSFSSH